MPMCQHKLGCALPPLQVGMEGIEQQGLPLEHPGKVEGTSCWPLRCRGTLCVLFGLLGWCVGVAISLWLVDDLNAALRRG